MNEECVRVLSDSNVVPVLLSYTPMMKHRGDAQSELTCWQRTSVSLK
jgi:hypothetical protein